MAHDGAASTYSRSSHVRRGSSPSASTRGWEVVPGPQRELAGVIFPYLLPAPTVVSI